MPKMLSELHLYISKLLGSNQIPSGEILAEQRKIIAAIELLVNF
jgi:hypothetical protein